MRKQIKKGRSERHDRLLNWFVNLPPKIRSGQPKPDVYDGILQGHFQPFDMNISRTDQEQNNKLISVTCNNYGIVAAEMATQVTDEFPRKALCVVKTARLTR